MEYDKIFQDTGFYEKGFLNWNFSYNFPINFSRYSENYKKSGMP